MTAEDGIDRLVGRRIAIAREGRGLSQRAFAAQLGWPAGTLANYESGRRRLTVAQLAHIAGAIGRSPAAFLVEAPTAASLLDRLGDNESLARQVAHLLTDLEAAGEPAVAPRRPGVR